jgi:hypothetical protein
MKRGEKYPQCSIFNIDKFNDEKANSITVLVEGTWKVLATTVLGRYLWKDSPARAPSLSRQMHVQAFLRNQEDYFR